MVSVLDSKFRTKKLQTLDWEASLRETLKLLVTFLSGKQGFRGLGGFYGMGFGVRVYITMMKPQASNNGGVQTLGMLHMSSGGFQHPEL